MDSDDLHYIQHRLDDVVEEAIELGLAPQVIDRLVEESIAWATKELIKEEFFESV